MDRFLSKFMNTRALTFTGATFNAETNSINITGLKIGESKDGQIWASFQNLAGFYFLKTTVLSNTNIKSLKGSKITFSNDINFCTIPSEEKKIKSNYSSISRCWVTKISYVVTKDQIKCIKNHSANIISLLVKNKTITFEGIIPIKNNLLI